MKTIESDWDSVIKIALGVTLVPHKRIPQPVGRVKPAPSLKEILTLLKNEDLVKFVTRSSFFFG
ncbi:MAG TPA: hypothetical protein DIW44_12125 [Anaerolineaceae bacterium]|nr:hypothetical protein [Anaerolineaceae bacterium]